MAAELFFIVLLFIIIGWAADRVVKSVELLAQRLSINIFFAGIILGLCTSAPEITISILSLGQAVPAIAYGNLLGGTIVLFGLVLAVSIIARRRIATDGKLARVLPAALYLSLPLILALDGSLGSSDGTLLALGYGALILYLYLSGGAETFERAPRSRTSGGGAVQLFTILFGLLVISITARLILELSLTIAERLGFSTFLLGLLLYAIGTNLPEIAIAARAATREVRTLSMSNLFGSAYANGLIIGLMALAAPVPVAVDATFLLTLCSTLILLLVASAAYKSHRSFTRGEGLLLLLIYLTFLLVVAYSNGILTLAPLGDII